MRQTVYDETRLTVSAGIAPNKVRYEHYAMPNFPLIQAILFMVQMLAKVKLASTPSPSP